MNNNNKYCLLTNDIETTSIWHNSLRDETGFKVFKEGMPILLDIYSEYDIKCTFFFTGYIAKLIPDIVKMVIPYGHEVGSHGLTHKKKDGFDIMPYKKQYNHLYESKKILEDITGQRVISFRAPALRTNDHTTRALIDSGFKIDSSIASQRFDMLLSFGSINKLKWLTSPRLPYYTTYKSLFKKGKSPLIEVPLSALLLPYIGTTMRIFPFSTMIQRNILNIECSINGKPIVFDIHPNEFINESNEKREIMRRSTNYLAYILKDLIRSKLKIKNLGLKAIPLYKNEIQFYKTKKYKFTTLKEYCTKAGFKL